MLAYSAKRISGQLKRFYRFTKLNLKETLELEITCKNNGWHRHAKKLERTRIRLETIISVLKSNDDEYQKIEKSHIQLKDAINE